MLQHVQKGQPLKIAAADWNKIIDAARAQQEAKGASARKAASTGNRSSGVILVKNASDQDQLQFAVMGIDAPIILPGADGHEDEFKRQVALSCVTPTAEHVSGAASGGASGGRFVILQEPLAVGAIGKACVSGVTNVKLQTDDPHDPDILTAGIVVGESNGLAAGGNGCSVLWAEEKAQPDGWRWAIVRLGVGGSVIFPARIDSADSGAHGWTEQRVLEGVFDSLPAGRSGTTTANAAYEINGRRNVPANTVVWISPSIGTDGSTQYTFDLGAGTPGPGVAMAYSGEHGEAAATTRWNINNQAGSKGLEISIMTGQRYDSSAETPVLYAYMRNLVFDANGHLMDVSVESRVAIDTPQACP